MEMDNLKRRVIRTYNRLDSEDMPTKFELKAPSRFARLINVSVINSDLVRRNNNGGERIYSYKPYYVEAYWEVIE